MNPEPLEARPAGGVAPHRGTLILILGIVSLVIFPPLGVVAWVMGGSDLRAMRAGRMDRSGQGMTRAGHVLGIVSTALLVLYLILITAAVLLFLGFRRELSTRPDQARIDIMTLEQAVALCPAPV